MRLITWLAAGHGPDVADDIEAGVINPDRAAAAERRPGQPLPQPRHSRDTLGDQPAGPRKIQAAGLVQ